MQQHTLAGTSLPLSSYCYVRLLGKLSPAKACAGVRDVGKACMSAAEVSRPASSVRRDRWGFFKRNEELPVGTHEASNQACKAHTVQGKRYGVREQRKPRHEPGWNDMHGVSFLERVTTTPS